MGSTVDCKTRTVEFPPGVRPVTLHGKAESWEAWLALTAEDGWEERAWEVEVGDTYPAGVHQQKCGDIRGDHMTVFPPRQPQAPIAPDALSEIRDAVAADQPISDAEEEAWEARP